MFSHIRKRITFANVAMTFALVFAMAGGAYAARKGWVITSKSQIKPSVWKQLQGKNGKDGANGLNGTGTNGINGKDGAQGLQGEKGPKGDIGAPGESVAMKAAATTECKKEGGVAFTVANKTEAACNGSPWAIGGLPKNASEMGEWNLIHFESSANVLGGAISFTVPLAKGLIEEHVHFIPAEDEAEGKGELTASSAVVKKATVTNGKYVVGAAIYDTTTPGNLPVGTEIEKVIEEVTPGEFELELSHAATKAATDSLKTGDPAGCKGTAEKPEAESGNLCVFAAIMQGTEKFPGTPVVSGLESGNAADKSGAQLEVYVPKAAFPARAAGTWVVTG